MGQKERLLHLDNNTEITLIQEVVIHALTSDDHEEVVPTLEAPPLFLDSDKKKLNPEYLDWAFKAIINKPRENLKTKQGREPATTRKMWEAFQKNSYARLTLEQLIPYFSNTQNPRKQVSNAVWGINQLFTKYGISLEIRGITVSSRDPMRTMYQIYPFTGIDDESYLETEIDYSST